MTKKNFTNKQIRKATVLELIFRLGLLHEFSKNRPKCAGVPMRDIWEAGNITRALKKRLARIMVFRSQDGGLDGN